MSSFEKILVEGYKGSKVNNLFINNQGDGLAILFPGIGYNNDMPLQYYAAKYFTEHNMDILRVDYHYHDSEDFFNANLEMKREWIRADVLASVENILKMKNYKEVVIVCKSLGTIAGLELLMAIEQFEHAHVIWCFS